MKVLRGAHYIALSQRGCPKELITAHDPFAKIRTVWKRLAARSAVDQEQASSFSEVGQRRSKSWDREMGS